MLNIFKKSQTKSVSTQVGNQVSRAKTTNELIDEIHDTFYSEVDKLLEQARVTLSTETQKAALIEKNN